MEAIKEAEVHVAALFEEEKKNLISRLEEKNLESEKYKLKAHDLEAQNVFKELELQRTRSDLEVI